jgi:hypothetical protein
MVNGPDDLYVERGGRIERALDGLFEGEEAFLHLMGWVGRGPGRGRFADRPSLIAFYLLDQEVGSESVKPEPALWGW